MKIEKCRINDFPWHSQVEEAIREISIATESIEKFIIDKTCDKIVFNNIFDVCDYWCECTYVGIKKQESIKMAFQKFFLKFYELILDIKKNPNLYHPDWSEITQNILFQGTVYRYLGHGDCKDNSPIKIIPEYDDFFVSWSKNRKNTYLEGKLHGTITKLTCEIKGEFYGIDLEDFGVSKADEAEVVFPTIESLITSIEYVE